MKRVISILIFAVISVAAIAQNSSKSNLVLNEWNTDLKTNVKFLDHQTKYNADGKKYEESEYNASGMEWKKVFEYDTKGLVSREIVYDGKGKIDNIRKFDYNELNNKKTEYIYNPKGQLIKIKEYEYLIK